MTTNMDESNSLKELMINIPKGNIVLRDDRIKSEWTVDIDNFLLAKYPVTQKKYISITGEFPSTFKGDQKPVESVSFIDAINYCNLLSEREALKKCYSFGESETEIIYNSASDGYRLPFEAEWEYACRAGNAKPIYGNIDEIAWY